MLQYASNLGKTYLVAQCNGVDFRSPPILSTTAPLETKYLEWHTRDSYHPN